MHTHRKNLLIIYVKLLGEVIRRSGVRCHQHAANIQLYLPLLSTAVDAIQTLDTLPGFSSGLDQSKQAHAESGQDRCPPPGWGFPSGCGVISLRWMG